MWLLKRDGGLSMMEEVMLFHGGNVPVPRCVTAAVSFMLAVPAPSAEAGTLCSGPLSLSPRAGSQRPGGESHLW